MKDIFQTSFLFATDETGKEVHVDELCDATCGGNAVVFRTEAVKAACQQAQWNTLETPVVSRYPGRRLPHSFLSSSDAWPSIIVFQDESIFHANDEGKGGWCWSGRQQIKPKSMGRGVMEDIICVGRVGHRLAGDD